MTGYTKMKLSLPLTVLHSSFMNAFKVAPALNMTLVMGICKEVSVQATRLLLRPIWGSKLACMEEDICK